MFFESFLNDTKLIVGNQTLRDPYKCFCDPQMGPNPVLGKQCSKITDDYCILPFEISLSLAQRSLACREGLSLSLNARHFCSVK